jgi:beta-lactamase class A
MRKFFLILLLCALSATAGYYFHKQVEPKANPVQFATALRSGQTGFINPLLEYDVSESFFRPEIKNFGDAITKLTNDLRSQGKANEISVYYRSLNDGPWFGVNENITYFPASLLKVPVMVAIYKDSETDPKILDQKITYDEGYVKTLGDFNKLEYFKPTKEIEVGKTYTVEELIERMIIYSDNNAKNLLVLNMTNPETYTKAYTDLGLVSPQELNSDQDTLTVHEYATFYRILYNASYLNKYLSNKTLSLLAQADFDHGISLGVPKDVQIAHKFGERADANFKQLHDCGIIYYPGNPYILCIMTRGDTYDNLESVIGTISKAVYDHVDKQIKALNRQ